MGQDVQGSLFKSSFSDPCINTCADLLVINVKYCIVCSCIVSVVLPSCTQHMLMSLDIPFPPFDKKRHKSRWHRSWEHTGNAQLIVILIELTLLQVLVA